MQSSEVGITPHPAGESVYKRIMQMFIHIYTLWPQFHQIGQQFLVTFSSSELSQACLIHDRQKINKLLLDNWVHVYAHSNFMQIRDSENFPTVPHDFMSWKPFAALVKAAFSQ